MIGDEGRELQRRRLQATFDIDAAREERAEEVTSAAGIRHGTMEDGHGRAVTSVFGPVRVTWKAYCNRREPNLYPAGARQVLPDDPYSLGMRSLAAFHLAGRRVRAGPGGHRGPHQRHRRPCPARTPRRRPRGLDDFYEERARDADTDLPDTHR